MGTFVRTKALVVCVWLVCFTSLAWADTSVDRVIDVSHQRTREGLKVSLQTADRAPQPSVYFLSRPPRLVIELNDALPATRAGMRPANAGLRSWSLKSSGLNRSRLTLNFREPPATSDVSVKVEPSSRTVHVEVPVDLDYQDKVSLTEGIEWVREDSNLGGRWVRLNRLVFDPQDPHIKVIVGLAKESVKKREKLSKMVKRYGAVAGINGGFFAFKGGALGLVYRDGKMLAPHVGRRPARSGFGLTNSGQPKIGRLKAVGSKIKDLDGGDWSDMSLALAGGPRLVQDGKTKVTARAEALGPGGNDITRVAGRTVVGITKGGKVLFGTVAGYSDNHSEGAQFGPVAGWLKSLGVTDAVNFDGGGSVNMVVEDHIVSDGPGNKTRERPISTALLVKDDRPKVYPSDASWSVGGRLIPADGKTEVDVSVSLRTPKGKRVPDGTTVRLLGHGVRVEPSLLTTKDGEVKAKVISVRRPGTARLTLLAGPLTEKKTLRLGGGSAQRILVELGEAELVQASNEDIEDESQLAVSLQRLRVRVQLVDEWGNPVKRESFEVAIDGTVAGHFRTDGAGLMSLEIDMDPAGGTFVVSHPVAGQLTTKIPAIRL